jgi:hypothetical protein
MGESPYEGYFNLCRQEGRGQDGQDKEDFQDKSFIKTVILGF